MKTAISETKKASDFALESKPDASATLSEKEMAMSHIITSGVEPAMVPGIRKAIEICKEYAVENMRIAHDDIRRICAEPGPTTMEQLDFSHQHGVRYHAGEEIVAILGRLIGEGDAA